MHKGEKKPDQAGEPEPQHRFTFLTFRVVKDLALARRSGEHRRTDIDRDCSSGSAARAAET